MVLHRDKACMCNICGKRFYRKFLLQSHMTAHSNSRPFQCTVCLKKFKRRQDVASHMFIHSPVKQFVCSVCGRSFRQKQGLHHHMEIHSTLSEGKVRLDKHMLIHADTKLQKDEGLNWRDGVQNHDKI